MVDPVMNFVFLSGDADCIRPGNADRRFCAIEVPGPVRVRTSAQDPFAGLRGHDYIKARGLDRSMRDCRCPTCEHARLLPLVLRICGRTETEA